MKRARSSSRAKNRWTEEGDESGDRRDPVFRKAWETMRLFDSPWKWLEWRVAQIRSWRQE